MDLAGGYADCAFVADLYDHVAPYAMRPDVDFFVEAAQASGGPVLEGEASVLVGDEVTVIETGGWHLRPHGVVHTFWNASDQPLRFIDMYPNQNFEDSFPELSALIGGLMSKGVSPASAEFLEAMQALDVKWGMTAFYDQRQPIVEQYGLQ